MKVAVVTTSRADYGLLYWPIKRLLADDAFEVQLIVSGTHLSDVHGTTVREIEADGFTVHRCVDLQLSADTSSVATCEAIAHGVSGFARALNELKADLVLVLGDRYEMFAAVQAALVMRIPVAHIAGGDITEGALDDSFRHCMTKMSHIHFPTNEAAAARIKQLGEDPERIFVVGSPGIDFILNARTFSREEIESALQFKLRAQNVLVTFHPETAVVDPEDALFDAEQLMAALDAFADDVGIIFTMPNADPGASYIKQEIEKFVERKANSCAHQNLGSTLYLSLARVVDAVVGNSSSGVYEVPSLGTATVNIGNRQKGRMFASSVINTPCIDKLIVQAIDNALRMDCSNTVNPYGDGNSSELIAKHLKRFIGDKKLLYKRFHSGSEACHTHS